jgi:5-methylcytosine-specific restriction protein A
VPVTFEKLILGEEYSRKVLAPLWGYKDWHPLGKGVFTPAKDNKIVLFVTREKQAALTQYEDHFEGDLLHMEGEKNHASDRRLAGAGETGDEIHLFYRERHHRDFTYFGQVTLVGYTSRLDAPSRFVLGTKRTEALAASAALTEEMVFGDGEGLAGETEGRKRYGLDVSYERSPANRAAAIRIHGTKCQCCGFDFNLVYGAGLARDYIQVHHVRSITEAVATPNPATDLVPLCSNCHSMVHRRHGEILTVEELRAIMREAATRTSNATVRG